MIENKNYDIDDMQDLYDLLYSTGYRFDQAGNKAEQYKSLYNALDSIAGMNVSPIVQLQLDNIARELTDKNSVNSRHLARMLNQYNTYTSAFDESPEVKRMNNRIIARIAKPRDFKGTASDWTSSLAGQLNNMGINYSMPRQSLSDTKDNPIVTEYLSRIGKPKYMYDKNKTHNAWEHLVGAPRKNKRLNYLISAYGSPAKSDKYTLEEIENLPVEYSDITKMNPDDIDQGNYYSAKEITEQLDALDKDMRKAARNDGTNKFLTLYFDGEEVPDSIKDFLGSNINNGVVAPGYSAKYASERGWTQNRIGGAWQPPKKKVQLKKSPEQQARQEQEAKNNAVLDEAFRTGDFSKIPERPTDAGNILSIFTKGSDGMFGPK